MFVPVKRTHPIAKMTWVIKFLVWDSSHPTSWILFKLMTSKFKSTWTSLNVSWEVEFDSLNAVAHRDGLVDPT